MTPASLGFSDMLSLLMRRKRLLLCSGVLTAVVALGLSQVLPLTYTSTGQVIVESQLTSDGTPSATLVSDVDTQVDMLQSPGLIRRAVVNRHLLNIPDVVPDFRLPDAMLHGIETTKTDIRDFVSRLRGEPPTKDDPVEKLTRYLVRHVAVKTKDKSNVITVSYPAGSPETAAKVVNAIVQTYLKVLDDTRAVRIATVDQWVRNETARRRRDVVLAEQKVDQFAQTHNIAQVQQSLTTAMQLNNDQTQLALAREDLTRKEALLYTVSHGGSIAGTEESLGLKTIQNLRSDEAGVVELLSALTPIDPRRGPLNKKLAGIRRLIAEQNGLITDSLTRSIHVAQQRVAMLQNAVNQEKTESQSSSVEGAQYKSLTDDLDGKRQALIGFATQATLAHLTAEQTPSARLLFTGVPPDRSDDLTVLALLAGFLAGTTGASGVVLSTATLTDTIRSGDDIGLDTGIPAIGNLPRMKGTKNLLAAPQTTSMVTETLRAMWLKFGSDNSGVGILVTSGESKEGKSTIAALLAHRFAEDGLRVLLVDADLRRPRISSHVASDASLEAVVDGATPLRRAVVKLKTGLDCLLTAGRIQNPLRMLSSSRFAGMLDGARKEYDCIVIDSPPVLRVADPMVLARYVDHIVLVIEAGTTSHRTVTEATRRFAEDDRKKLFGLVTRVHPRDMDTRHYYGGYDSAKGAA